MWYWETLFCHTEFQFKVSVKWGKKQHSGKVSKGARPADSFKPLVLWRPLKVPGSTKSLLVQGDWAMTSEVKTSWEASANLSLDVSVNYLTAMHYRASQRVEDRVAGLDVPEGHCLLGAAISRQQTSTQAGWRQQVPFKTLQVISWSWVFQRFNSCNIKGWTWMEDLETLPRLVKKKEIKPDSYASWIS